MLILLLFAHATFAARPFDCDEALAHYSARAQPPAARERVIVNFARGLSPTLAVSYSPPHDLPWHDQARAFAEPEFSLEVAMNQPFAARFVAFPAHLTNLTDPGDARVFAMHLRASEVDKYFGGTINRAASARVPEAMAYLIYHRRGDDFIVSAINAEGYTAPGKPVVGSRFAGWDVSLLYAFERFAAAVGANQRARVVIAGPRANSARENRLYRSVPESLGYHATTAFEAVGGIRDGYALTLGETGARVGRVEAFQNLNLNVRDRAEAARADLQKRAPRVHVAAAIPAPPGSAAEVKFTAYPTQRLYLNKHQRALHDRILRTVPPWADDVIKIGLVSIGRGPTGPATWNHRVVDVSALGRAEGVVDVRLRGNPGVVSVLGAGRSQIDDGSNPQIFAPTGAGGARASVAGGLSEREGRFDVQQHLHLWALGERAKINPAIAVPLAVGWLDQLPRAEGDERWLVPADEYLEHELYHAPGRLVQARYFARAGHRVGEVIAALDTEKAVATAAAPLLREIYEVFTENLNLPTNEVPREQYLNEVATLNGQAPARILRRWAERSLATIGLVHGAGGHLGGALVYPPRDAGATSKNSITLAGELRWIDENVFIPSNPQRADGEAVNFSAADLELHRRGDLERWAVSYALVTALLGLREPSLEVFDQATNAGIVDVYDPSGYKFRDKVLGDAYAHAFERGAGSR